MAARVAVAAAVAAVVAGIVPWQAAEPPQADVPADGVCSGPGPGLELHRVRQLSPSPPPYWFSNIPEVVVDATGRATVAFLAGVRGPRDSSAWSVDLRGSHVDAQQIRAGNEGTPRLGVDAAGNQTVVLYEYADSARHPSYRLLAATRPAGGSWSTPTVLASRPGFAAEKHLAVNGSGAAIATWEHDETRLYASYRSSATSPWSAPHLVTRDYYAPTEVGIDAAGNAVVKFYRRSGVWVQRRDVGTGTWTATRLSDSVHAVMRNTLAVSADGTAIASWLRQPGYRWFTARMRADGTWRPRVQVRVPPRSSPGTLAVDGRGQAWAVWTGRHGNVMVTRTRPDGTWRHSTLLARAQRSRDSSVPRVLVNGRGDALVVWRAGGRADNQLRGRYRPVGEPWTPACRLTPARVPPGYFEAAIGERGEAVIAWTRRNSVWARVVTLCP